MLGSLTTKVVALAPRFEYYDDTLGAATNMAQKIKDVTATLELTAADNLLGRIEYRGDISDKAVFADESGAFHKSQHSLSLGALYSFATKGQ